MNIKITHDSISPALAAGIKGIHNNAPLMLRLGNLVANFAKDAFRNTSKRPEPWADLSPVTVRRKGHNRPLVEHGMLKRSPRVSSYHNNEAIVSSDRKAGSYSLAAIHHYGAPRARIPARPFFPFFADGTPLPSLAKQAEGIVQRYLKSLGFG